MEDIGLKLMVTMVKGKKPSFRAVVLHKSYTQPLPSHIESEREKGAHGEVMNAIGCLLFVWGMGRFSKYIYIW